MKTQHPYFSMQLFEDDNRRIEICAKIKGGADFFSYKKNWQASIGRLAERRIENNTIENAPVEA